MGIRINANGKKVNQTYWQNIKLIGNSLVVNYLLDFGATIKCYNLCKYRGKEFLPCSGNF